MAHLVLPAARAALLIALLLPLGACKKEGDSKGSGALTDTEASLIGLLPADANVVFGADYGKVMSYWETSPLKRLAESALAGQNGMRSYMECWIKQNDSLELVGSMSLAGNALSMTMVVRGMGPGTFATCAKDSGFVIHKDADGKYLEIRDVPDGRGGTSTVGYLFPDPKTAITSMDVSIGGLGIASSRGGNRSELEALLAKYRANPASKSEAIKSMLGRADRTKAFWFTGSTANTPAADKLGSGHGYIDASKDALIIGFSVELDSAATASEAVDQFKQLRSMVGAAPPKLRDAAESFLDASKLSASGKTLNGRFEITNKMLDSALPALRGMMPGL
jgi:hypothetical protein